MENMSYENFETLRKSAGDSGASNILSALLGDELCQGFMNLIPPRDGEGVDLFISLMDFLLEKNCDNEMVQILRLLCKASDTTYPPALEWAEKDSAFLRDLLCELCEDFEDILREEHEYAVIEENGGAEL